jgi:hypothetical protein
MTDGWMDGWVDGLGSTSIGTNKRYILQVPVSLPFGFMYFARETIFPQDSQY